MERLSSSAKMVWALYSSRRGSREMIALPAPCAHFRYAAPSLRSVCYALRLNKDCERDYFPFHFATYIQRKKLKEHFNGKRKI